MAQRPAIVFISTSHADFGNTGNPTGLWLEEFTTPYYAVRDAGFHVTVASIKGKKVPVAPESNNPAEPRQPSVERFLADAAAMETLEHSVPVDQIDVDDFDAVFVAGGHGAMWDLPHSAPLAVLLARAHADGKPIGAVCHGVAALVNVKDEDGVAVVQGRRVAGFTDAEEAAIGVTALVPFLLETRLRELGAQFEAAGVFQPHVVTDGNLITGQNPASSALVARELVERLGRSQRAA